MTYPVLPGFKEPTTSAEAAAEIAPDAARLRGMTLEQIARKSDTADGVAHALGVNFLSIRPRCSELRRLGLIKDSGVRGRTPSGRRAIVWELTEAGRRKMKGAA